MQLRPFTGWESLTCYPSMHSRDNPIPACTAKYALYKKEAAKAQISGQADTAKWL